MQFMKNADQGKAAVGWYLLGLVIIFICWQVAGEVPLLGYSIYVALTDHIDIKSMAQSLSAMNFTAFGANPYIGYALLLLAFPIGWIGVWFSARFLHQRSFLSFFTANRFRWKYFFTAFGLWMLLTILGELGMYLYDPTNYYFSFKASEFFPSFFISLILIPWQSGFEELLMRGYLMQGFFRWFRIPIVAVFITGLIFGLLHSFNPEVSAFGFWKAMPFYVAFGLFAGLITATSDGIELSMGLHIANNLYASIFVTFPDSVLQTNTVFAQKSLDVDAANFITLIAYGICMLLFMLLFRWRNLSQLFRRIPKTIEPTAEVPVQ